MKEAFRRMNTMAYQLEQAYYAEGILDKEVLGKILDCIGGLYRLVHTI